MTKALAVDEVWPRPANFSFRDLAPVRAPVSQAVLEGFASVPKRLPPFLFYDARGAQLFECISRTPDYYVTATEAGILARCRRELGELIDERTVILEYGAGEMQKIRSLLAAGLPARYVAVDIAREQLVVHGVDLARDFPLLSIEVVHADYAHLQARELALPEDCKRLFFFPGSTVGNLEPQDAEAFLRGAADIVGVKGCAIVGVDLQKDSALLHRAYNDSAGLTARFNLNVLARINREVGADFVLSQFEHVAFYNSSAARIEMHLRSRCAQTVTVSGHRFDLAAGELVHTENSYKYLPEGFAALAKRAGFGWVQMWTDDDQQFGVFVLRANPPLDPLRSFHQRADPRD